MKNISYNVLYSKTCPYGIFKNTPNHVFSRVYSIREVGPHGCYGCKHFVKYTQNNYDGYVYCNYDKILKIKEILKY